MNVAAAPVDKVCNKCIWPCKQTGFLYHCKHFEKDGPMGEAAPTVAEALELNAADLIKAIDKATNKDALQALQEYEAASGRARKRVMKAITGRLDYLTNWREIPGV